MALEIIPQNPYGTSDTNTNNGNPEEGFGTFPLDPLIIPLGVHWDRFKWRAVIQALGVSAPGVGTPGVPSQSTVGRQFACSVTAENDISGNSYSNKNGNNNVLYRQWGGFDDNIRAKLYIKRYKSGEWCASGGAVSINDLPNTPRLLSPNGKAPANEGLGSSLIPSVPWQNTEFYLVLGPYSNDINVTINNMTGGINYMLVRSFRPYQSYDWPTGPTQKFQIKEEGTRTGGCLLEVVNLNHSSLSGYTYSDAGRKEGKSNYLIMSSVGTKTFLVRNPWGEKEKDYKHHPSVWYRDSSGNKKENQFNLVLRIGTGQAQGQYNPIESALETGTARTPGFIDFPISPIGGTFNKGLLNPAFSNPIFDANLGLPPDLWQYMDLGNGFNGFTDYEPPVAPIFTVPVGSTVIGFVIPTFMPVNMVIPIYYCGFRTASWHVDDAN